jgi:DNA-binding protein HU-beta
MNKQDLVAKVAEKAGLSKKDAEGAVSAFVDVVKETVAGGDAVQLIGFGTFASRERAAREARNPRTGEKIKIAAAKTPAFKPGKAFKDAVNVKKGKKK